MFIVSQSLLAQDRLAIGQWKSLLPLTTASWVTQSDDEIFYAMQFSVLALQKDDLNIRLLDKTNSLNDAAISFLRYDHTNKILLIAYQNSNIDLLGANDQVTNINDIKRRTDILGDKSIYDVFFEGESAFLACGFGLVKLNLKTGLIDFTTFTNLKINAFTQYGNHYYMATDEGIFRAPATGVNLLDFSIWQPFTLQEQAQCRVILSYKNKLYFDKNNILLAYNGESLDTVYQEPNFRPHFLSIGQQKIIAGVECLAPDCRGKVVLLHDDGTKNDAALNGQCYDFPTYTIEDEQERLWFSDKYDFIRYKEKQDNFCKTLQFNNRPYTQLSYDLAIHNDALWVATGGTTVNRAEFQYKRLGFMSYQKGIWTSHREANTPQLSEMFDPVAIAIHPSTGEVFTGFQQAGIVRYDGTNYEIIKGILNRISGLKFDNKHNLWISNSLAERPIAVRKPDGEILDFPSPTPFITSIDIDIDNNKWFASWNGNGVVVFNEGDDLANPNDDRYRHINTSNSVLPTNSVNCLATDLDGNVWVGTANGVVVFECGSSVYDAANCAGGRRVVKRPDGNNEYLLEGQNITTIAIDGANRKWFGTNNGVFVQSASGLNTISTYTVDNSPLPSNMITDIAINPQTGQVFIGTDIGIVSLQGEATLGGQKHRADVTAFPNPFNTNEQEVVVIRGLPRDANVKITDVQGNLAFETKALGGQALWNGKDSKGRTVASGVYLVFSTTSDAYFDTPESIVTKIIVIR